jgi:hypothetical protein
MGSFWFWVGWVFSDLRSYALALISEILNLSAPESGRVVFVDINPLFTWSLTGTKSSS